MNPLRPLGLLAFCAVIACAPPAQAERGASVALLAGYGASQQPNVLGLGGGLRGGYRFDSGVYLGALALAHLGTSDEGEADVRHHAQSLRGELGYGFALPALELRPSLRVGAVLVTTARDRDGEFVSPDLGVGLTLIVPFERLFVGADVEGRAFTRLVDNFDNLHPIQTVAAYLTAGYAF